MSDIPPATSGFFYVLQEETRILYVDDDPILREFASVNLTSERATLASAADGVEAIEALAAGLPDVMILDLEMPRMDGFEVLERVRANPVWSRLPVIVATGREDLVAIDRAFGLGATSFVVKPVNWRLLGYQIRYVLRSGDRGASVQTDAIVAERLQALAAEGARFIASAVARDAGLRAEAAQFADALERVASVAAAGA